jgi:hypothetical protein
VALDLAHGRAHARRHRGEPRQRARFGVGGVDLVEQPRALGGEILRLGLSEQEQPRQQAG